MLKYLDVRKRKKGLAKKHKLERCVSYVMNQLIAFFAQIFYFFPIVEMPVLLREIKLYKRKLTTIKVRQHVIVKLTR